MLKKINFKKLDKTFIIAEIGINHNGSVDEALRLIDSASKTGCSAVKFQTYITEKRVDKKHSELFEILKKCELKFSDFEKLKNHAEEKNLTFFSTPFDNDSANYLDSINVDLYKIASFDVTNKKFLKHISNKGKPVILSVGMANLNEVENAVDVLKMYNNQIAILHCVSSYPMKEKDANLGSIYKLKKLFKHCLIGQSDHTNGIKIPLYAVACGAKILEKHYKIDSNMNCVDAPVSITENQMKDLVNKVNELEEIIGKEEILISEAEKDTMVFRRNSTI